MVKVEGVFSDDRKSGFQPYIYYLVAVKLAQVT